MTDQPDSGTTAAETTARPTTYHGASRSDRTWLDARDRYDELTQRDLSARVRVTLVEMGEYDPVKHGASDPEPLTLTEDLEVLANGEVVARVYRHPYQVHRALEAGATWGQIADATGGSEDQARREYREFAEGQHRLWTGELGGSPGRFGMNHTDYATAIARASEEHGPEVRVKMPGSAVTVTYTDQRERDRSLRLAEARQAIAAEGVLCLPWAGLSDAERELAATEARNWLRAVGRAGLLTGEAGQ